METKTHVVFDRANTNQKIDDEDDNGAFNAIDIGTDKAFRCHCHDDPEKESVELEVFTNEPVTEAIDVLEIAFHKGKQRKTKFSVDYIDTDDKKHHIGTYESSGETTNYEKFLLPEKIKGFKGIVVTFKGNNDKSPWFAVKGIRLAKFIEKTL